MRVKISQPDLPDGYEISLTGLPALLRNNEDVEVDDEAIAQYEAFTGKQFSELLKSKKFGGPGRPKPETKEKPQEEAPSYTYTEIEHEDGEDS